MMSAFFYFEPTLNSFFNNRINLYRYYISSFWNMKGRGQIDTPHKKLVLKSPALVGLKG